jgi:predicted nuclease of predicted toxin-antitoxin system
MKFLLDQDVYASTERFLKALSHDVVLVGQIGLAQADDEDLLKTAYQLGRIFVTRDRDFGNLVFVRNLGAGVIYLRILPSTQTVVHDELARVLVAYSQDELLGVFITIELGGHRIRRLSGPNNGHES